MIVTNIEQIKRYKKAKIKTTHGTNCYSLESPSLSIAVEVIESRVPKIEAFYRKSHDDKDMFERQVEQLRTHSFNTARFATLIFDHYFYSLYKRKYLRRDGKIRQPMLEELKKRLALKHFFLAAETLRLWMAYANTINKEQQLDFLIAHFHLRETPDVIYSIYHRCYLPSTYLNPISIYGEYDHVLKCAERELGHNHDLNTHYNINDKRVDVDGESFSEKLLPMLKVLPCDCGKISRFVANGKCWKCLGMKKIENLKLRSYADKAEKVFKTDVTKIKGLPVGVELELDGRTPSNCFGTILYFRGFGIVKSDGSVQDGLEIATKPSTVQEIKNKFKGYFEKLPTGLHPTTKCGMHVHVNKASLSMLQIGKMIGFMNQPKNEELLATIAGRPLKGGYTKTDMEKAKIINPKTDPMSRDRYNAINIAPQNTIEFRIFAATIEHSKFCANLDFVQALVDYTCPAGMALNSIKDIFSEDRFLSFVASRRKYYPDLFQFLVSQTIIPAPKKPKEKAIPCA
jgi:hypothetical protein